MLNWVGFLGARFEVGGGGVNSLESCQKLEIWCESTHPYVFSENIPFSTKTV